MDKKAAIDPPPQILDRPRENGTLHDQELGIVPVSLERIEQVYR